MKELKISTKLASAVLGKEVTKCSLINKARNSINITYFEDKEDFNTICREWNIYEFAFKCKEWAYINDYNVIDYKIGKKELDVFIIKADKNDFNKVEKIFYHNSTLVEGAIKACEWILEQNKKDNQWLYYQYGELNGVAAGIDAGAIYHVIVIYFYLGKKKWN